jgi:hypothetical protein
VQTLGCFVAPSYNAEADESMDLHEAHGVTTLTWTMTFRDKIGRDHMTKYDGIAANLV